MSVNSFNYTGRQRISHDRVQIGLAGQPPAAALYASFRLNDLGFPPTARIVLEAQAGWIVQRFEFGTIETRTSPFDSRLSEFSSLSGLIFRLKVVATGDHAGQLLGVADGIRAASDIDLATQQSFVVVRPHDLGQRVWKLSLDGDQPLMLVNSRIPDHQDFLKRREVAALVLPEAFEQMLRFAEGKGIDEDEQGQWTSIVIRMGEKLSGRRVPSSDDEDDFSLWLEEAVGAFSRNHALLDAFLADSNGGDT